MEHRRRVVITGIGSVSPNGMGSESYLTACLAGRSGVTRLDGVDTSRLRSRVAGQVRGFDPLSLMEPAEVRRVPRTVHLALAASREAMAQAGLAFHEQDAEGQRSVGVALGTGGGGLAFVEEQYRAMFSDGGTPALYSITAGTHGNLSSELSIALRLRGPSHVLSTGCTSSTDALGYATMMIRSGIVPAMLSGGADAPIAAGIIAGFEKMRVISTRTWDDPSRASRPFSKDRDGFVLGEGAWMFVLEEREHATARGATILAEIAGYGSTCDAYHRVQIKPDVVEPVRAMELALTDAGVAKDEVGYINVHGTGTALNDRLETQAVKNCFGQRAGSIPVSSTKSMIGHPQGACGAAGVAATALAMRAGAVHPTINLEVPDPECDLDYVKDGARRTRVDVALCNCIAFGSKNSALVLTSAR